LYTNLFDQRNTYFNFWKGLESINSKITFNLVDNSIFLSNLAQKLSKKMKFVYVF
jgi:hypothetical protein